MIKHSLLVLASMLSAFVSGQNIVSSLKDHAGNLWFTVSEKGIFRYDGNTFSRFSGYLDNRAYVTACIYQDRAGNLWFKTSDGGICSYNGTAFRRFVLPMSDSSATGPDKYSTLVKIPVEVSTMLQDKKGNFWFLTMNHGVYRFSGDMPAPPADKAPFTHFFVGSKEAPWPVCISEDGDGNILIGCWDGTGAHYYDGTKFISLIGLTDGMIGCITTDRTGRTWYGTRINGVGRLNGSVAADGKVEVTNFSEFTKYPDHEGNCSLAIFQDSKDNMWIATNWNNLGLRGDAFVYDGKSFTNITRNERTLRFADFAARSFVEDNDGNVWIGSKNGILLRYDSKGLTDFSSKLSD